MPKTLTSRSLWLFLWLIAGVAAAETHKLRVHDPALTESLIAGGGRLIADYGAFQIVETDRTPTPAQLAGRAEDADALDVIQLNAGRLDTRNVEIQALRKPVAPFAGARLHVIHFAGPIKSEWLAALEKSGVQIVDYVPNNAYLVYGDSAALRRLQAWGRTAGYVQWDGKYQDDYKIHPAARINRSAARQGSVTTNGLFAVQLVVDTNANPATLALLERLKLEPIRNEWRVLHFLTVVVRLPEDRLAEIAAQPDVISIQPMRQPVKLDERQDQIVAGNVIGDVPSGPGYLAWLAGRGFSQSQFTASAFVVDVCDSGIDNGTLLPGHFGLYCQGDPSRPGRVAYNRLEGTPNDGSTIQGCDGHGNLNAHIVAGYCGFTGFPFTDSTGYEYGLGVCPFVKVGSSVIFDPDTFTYPNFADQQSDAYQSGARISANSWGSLGSDGAYDAQSQLYDALVRDAQPAGSTNPTPGNQQMVIIFSAGNEGPAGSSVSSPGTAKNVITVGASENVRSLLPAAGGNDTAGNDGCDVPDSEADSGGDIADFSSRGPCTDGRAKPDLVAPGTHIVGGVAQGGAPSTNGVGSALSCFSAEGVSALMPAGACGVPVPGNSNNYFPLGQQFYTVSSGTSHSAPAVAGACALLRQDFINHGFSPPSPAMTKACLLNAARYLTGNWANDNLWSTSQGMGELTLAPLFDGVPRILQDQIPADKFTASGQTRTITGTISDPTKPLRVTLAWTDAPGNTFGNAFNNDLDLTVTVGGYVYKGNVFAGGWSTTGGAFDRKNNVESVFLPAGLSGNFAVTVTAANINSDGVPNDPPALDQDFALVVYNAVQHPLPVMVVGSAVISAENCSPTNGVFDPGETATVAFALRNVGTADTTNLVATLLATNGVAAPGGPLIYGAVPAGGASVTQSVTLTAYGSCGGIIMPVLKLHDGASNLGTLTTSFLLGSELMGLLSATNATSVLIPGSGTMGPGSPYPSSVTLSGVAGTVQQVTVTLMKLAHQFPGDVGVLLVGPTGTNVILEANSGGGTSITNVTLTFDDSATMYLPDQSTIVSGTYLPSGASAFFEDFFPPAPSSPYGTTLSVFNGLDPNGTWSLYAQDTASSDTGVLQQGWRLSITTSNLACCTGAPPPAPVIQSITLSNSTSTVTWSALPGQTYRMEYNLNLNGGTWNTVWPYVTATNVTASSSTPIFPGTQCFYRVLTVP